MAKKLAMPWLEKHIVEMQKAMDNSKDVPGAIYEVLKGVYFIGVRDGIAGTMTRLDEQEAKDGRQSVAAE